MEKDQVAHTIFKTRGWVDAATQHVELMPCHGLPEYYVHVDGFLVGYAHVYDLAKVIFPDDAK